MSNPSNSLNHQVIQQLYLVGMKDIDFPLVSTKRDCSELAQLIASHFKWCSRHRHAESNRHREEQTQVTFQQTRPLFQ